MAPSRRSVRATAALTETPPDSLPPKCSVARIVKNVGNNIYAVKFPTELPRQLDQDQSTTTTTTTTTTTAAHDHRRQSQQESPETCREANDSESQMMTTTTLVELPARFRNVIWLKNGGFVVVDQDAFAGRGNKLGGEIVNVVREERAWMRMPYWPEEFKKKQAEDSDDDDSRVGKLPPSGEDSE